MDLSQSYSNMVEGNRAEWVKVELESVRALCKDLKVRRNGQQFDYGDVRSIAM